MQQTSPELLTLQIKKYPESIKQFIYGCLCPVPSLALSHSRIGTTNITFLQYLASQNQINFGSFLVLHLQNRKFLHYVLYGKPSLLVIFTEKS